MITTNMYSFARFHLITASVQSYSVALDFRYMCYKQTQKHDNANCPSAIEIMTDPCNGVIIPLGLFRLLVLVSVFT